jgi:hypothetical protein
MFTVCDKKTGTFKSQAPFVYTFDPEVNKPKDNVFFSSLLSGVDNATMSIKNLDIETELRGQDSSKQVFCRQGTTTLREVQLPHPNAINEVLQREYELASQVTSVVSPAGSGLGRNAVAGKFAPVRMSLDR